MVDIEVKKHYSEFELDVSFMLKDEVLALLGPSGSGKSTILNCIAGIVKPDDGKVWVNDNPYFDAKKKIDLPIWKRRIGYVFQSYALFPHMTVSQNVIYGMKNYSNWDEEESGFLNQTLERFQLSHLKNRYPQQLSGGEKQRVALARSLVFKPEILLLDEPFSALDCHTKECLYKEFLEIKQRWQISMILITHDEEEAQLLADRTLKIKDGKTITDA